MKLHPLLQAVISIVPDFRYIFDVRFNMGRSKVSWIYGQTKYGKVSRFVSRKKLTKYFWKSSDTIINLEDKKQYITKLNSCTCPAFKWGEGKPCKHMQMLSERLSDAVKPKSQKPYQTIQTSENKTPENMTLRWNGDDDSDMTFEILYDKESIGFITECGQNMFQLWDKFQKFIGDFSKQEDAYEAILRRHEVDAAQSIFGNDVYDDEPDINSFPDWGGMIKLKIS